MAPEILTIKNLTFTYPKNSAPTLVDLSFSVKSGQFVVLCGSSGCGKTTLLRHLKPSLTPHGLHSATAEICFEGRSDLEEEELKIGFVMQSPDNQIVTDKVWHELAFGLENLGMDTPSIRRRVAEIASFFGIQAWFHKNTDELSGGQKQMLNLASIMVMQPSVLILDEPTSQLDPIAAAEFLDIIGKINRELGITVILTEHRLDEVFAHADRVIVMDKGRLIADGTPREIGMSLRRHGMFAAMPVPMRVYAATDSNDICPVSVREGKAWLELQTIKNTDIPKKDYSVPRTPPAVELDAVWFKYEKNLPDVLKGLSFRAYPGELCAVLGGNGTGKTTALSLIAGLNKPYRGKVKLYGEELRKIPDEKLFDGFLGVLPQNPQSIFVKKTVEEDLAEMTDDITEAQLTAVAGLCNILHLMKSHPYDLSGGEQQRAALAKVLLLNPKLLLLDEPTKGLDAEFKQAFAEILRNLTKQGVCVVMISHDVEFCAEYADRCALLFDGDIVSEGDSQSFFAGNTFYTTAANRMARQVLPNAVTANDIITALGGTPHKKVKAENTPTQQPTPKATKQKLSVGRACTALTAGAAFITALALAIINGRGMLDFISGGDLALNAASDTAAIWRYTAIIGVLLLSVAVFFISLNREEHQTKRIKRKLSKRTLAAAIMILLTIPITIYCGIHFLDDRKYYFISMLIILQTMIPFALVFEKRKPQARELIIITVLCAIAVAGRAAFFMLPQFKPVAALVIISGIAFGGEAGFLVGAMTAFISNIFFGQGAWTPWQMFAFGIIGFLAGVCFRRGILVRSRIAMCVFGFFAAFIIYGGIMNPTYVLMFQQVPTKEMFYLAYLQGIPFDLVHAAATVMFLAVTANPMLEKLDRIKVKYGLIE